MKTINRIGIMQGRLTNYKINSLSIYPKSPLLEIDIAKKFKLSHIEFLTEEYLNKNNLIWSDKKIKQIRNKIRSSKLKIISFIDNYSIKNSLAQNNNSYYEILISQAAKLKVKNFIIPLLGSSQVNNKNYFKFIEPLNRISNICSMNKINFLVEVNINFKLYMKLRKKIKTNFAIVFDTGNNCHQNINYLKEMKLFKKHIKHIHLKDRNNKGHNVIFGNGLVDFKSIFSILNKINYRGFYTIECTRNMNAQATLKHNLNYIKECLKKN